jgi:hypothetical protein
MLTPLRFWWHELNTWQPQEAMAFYGSTLGWTFEPMQLTNGISYWTARKAGLPIGGILALEEDQHEGIPSHWMTYMAVDAMEAAVAETLRAGGTVERPAVAVPGVGALAVVADPAGALVGLMEPDQAHRTALARTGGWGVKSVVGSNEETRPAPPVAQAR